MRQFMIWYDYQIKLKIPKEESFKRNINAIIPACVMQCNLCNIRGNIIFLKYAEIINI